MKFVDGIMKRQREIYFEKAVISLIICCVLYMGLLVVNDGTLDKIILNGMFIIVLLVNYLFRNRLPEVVNYRLFAVVITVFLLLLEWSSTHSLDYLWVIFFPITYYTLFGRKEGLFWSIGCILLLSINIIVRDWLRFSHLEFFDVIVIIVVYVLLVSIMYQIEVDREAVSTRIEELEGKRPVE